jgi:hypothetical protein
VTGRRRRRRGGGGEEEGRKRFLFLGILLLIINLFVFNDTIEGPRGPILVHAPLCVPVSRTQSQAESEGIVVLRVVAYAGLESPAAALRNIGTWHISMSIYIGM